MSITRCRPSAIRSLRALFLEELNAQFRYEATHLRRWATSYLVQRDGRSIGYASIRHVDGGRGTVFDFYLLPPLRSHALEALRGVIREANPEALECQTNDRFFASLVPQLATEISSDTILFAAPAGFCSTTTSRTRISSWKFVRTRAAAATDPF